MEPLPAGSNAVGTRAVTSLANPILTGAWASLGPQPIADEKAMNGASVPVSDYGPAAGRVTSMVTNPNDPNVVYIGTAGGGGWKTTNGGASWSTTTDSQPSLAIGA